jgi:hypothetical protein
VLLNDTLKFCLTVTDGGSCCDAAADAVLQEQFDAMGVDTDGACARLVKSILCSVRTFSLSRPTILFFSQGKHGRCSCVE